MTQTTFWEAVDAFKRELIRRRVEEAGGNRTHAADGLGLGRTQLLALVRKFGVSLPPRAPRNRRVVS